MNPDNFEKQMGEKKKIREEELKDLLKLSLPPSIEFLVRSKIKDEEVDYSEQLLGSAVTELFCADNELREGIIKSSKDIPWGQQIVTKVTAYRALQTKEDVRKFILDEIVDGKDPYFMINVRDGREGDAYCALYLSLIGAVKAVPENNSLLKVLEIWEGTILDMLIDRETFFKIGTHAMRFISEDSPYVRNGKYIQRIRESIRYREIMNYKISNLKEIVQQQYFLFLLDVMTNESRRGELPLVYFDNLWQHICTAENYYVNQLPIKGKRIGDLFWEEDQEMLAELREEGPTIFLDNV